MLKLLEKAREQIKKEMNRVGFIDDSDNCDRFLDELARNLVEEELVLGDDIKLYYEKEEEIEELAEKLLDMIKDEVMINYDSMSVTDGRGNYSGCWYKDLKGLVEWADTWKENSLEEAYQEFIDIYGIDITLKQFKEAYDIEPEDYLDDEEQQEK